MNGFYYPYWLNNEALEHYGVKGMKWDFSKRRTKFQLKDVEFGEVRIFEILDWLSANKNKSDKDSLSMSNLNISIPTNSSKYKVAKSYPSITEPLTKAISSFKSSVDKAQKRIRDARKKYVNSLDKVTIAIGTGAISAILHNMKK